MTTEFEIFHEGEIAIHEHLGLREDMQQKGGNMISREMSFALQIFYHLQTFVLMGSIDADGYPWASMLCGGPGFLKARNSKTLQIRAKPVAGDPLNDNLAIGSPLGTMTIEFDNRLRRGRVNGLLQSREDDLMTLSVVQAYSNCSKYIQLRKPETPGTEPVAEVGRSPALTREQARRIEQADTFFIASYNLTGDAPSHGVDVSHRGGNPGFIKVDSESQIVFPDYRGNMAFNSLGNILRTPKVGLMFMDFERGHTLQITGDATLELNSPRLKEFPGATSLVFMKVTKVVELAHAVPFRWSFVKMSPANPMLVRQEG